jgi:caffeoyl-CoA O-methyltransferase
MLLVGAVQLAYVRANSLRESEAARRLREETERLPNDSWASAPEVAQLLAFLLQTIGAKRVLEIGVFTGYGTLVMASALPADGRIIACDIPEAKEYTDIAQRHWREAGVTDKIDFRVAPAIETLDALVAEGQEESFDFAYIDADKEPYDAYYERALQLLRPGGLIVFDNMLWDGVEDPGNMGRSVRAIRALNAKLHKDERISLSMLPIDDGVTLALKRP